MKKDNEGRDFYKDALVTAGVLVALIIGLRFTSGAVALGIVCVGIFAALTNRRGLALSIYLLLPFFVVFNPLIIPKSGLMVLSARVGGVLMIMSMIIAATRSRGTQAIPLGSLGPYFIVALISSTTGYLPIISYFKILNCVIFFSGIYFGSRNIHHHPEDIYLLRRVFFAFALVVFFGSLATLPFPGVAYYTGFKGVLATSGFEEMNYLAGHAEGMTLFTGIVGHSQMLAPLACCLTGWVFCDMIVVERRIRWLHALMLAIAPVFLYMTRSRAGLLSFSVVLVMVCVYCVPHLRLPTRVKSKVRSFVILAGIALTIGAGVAEARNSTISRWIRKTEDVSGDQRSVSEAFTASRQGGMDESMHDFRKSPLIGMGFQVTYWHPAAYQAGMITWYSAFLERGFIGTAILGECGVLGLLAFLFFLLMFWLNCARKKYFVTFSLFIVYLSTNMAEMTFFSPGGAGGIEWLVTVVGGFVIDLAAQHKTLLSMLRDQQTFMAARWTR